MRHNTGLFIQTKQQFALILCELLLEQRLQAILLRFIGVLRRVRF